jgi:hypothetical protein
MYIKVHFWAGALQSCTEGGSLDPPTVAYREKSPTTWGAGVFPQNALGFDLSEGLYLDSLSWSP